MDAGYLSRLVTGLVEAGLIDRQPSPENAKRLTLRLIEAGRAVYAKLDATSAAEAGALLAGDGLSIWAFHKISELPEGVPPEVGLQLVQDLAVASGHPGMVGGQVIDMAAQQGSVTQEMLEAVHRAKTGALITGAVRAGAMLAGATVGTGHGAGTEAERLGNNSVKQLPLPGVLSTKM